MKFRRSCLLLPILLIFSFSGIAQILNDTTKNVYGPQTTRYFLEEDVLNSIDTLYYIDTTLNAFQRYSYPQRFEYKYQDLGNKASAIQPLFYKSPSNIGFRSGYTAYDMYWEDVLDLKFYDTRSPYSKFHYVQGGKGVSFLKTELSRNVNPNWNLGITFNRLAANSQINFEPRPDNPESDHYSYSAYTAFKTDDEKYYVNASFKRMNHRVRETGGVALSSSFFSEDDPTKLDLGRFFENYDGHTKELNNAISGDLRINYHLYHQFRFSDLVGLYHLFDHTIQKTSYEDASSPLNTDFYGTSLIDNTATPKEFTIFKTYQNDVGLKGEINEFKYRFFYRRRNFFVDNMRIADVNWESEDITGGEFAVRFSERAFLHIKTEILGTTSYRYKNNEQKDYRIDFSFENRFVKAVFNRGRYSPSYLQQIHFSNHHSWDYTRELNSTTSNDLSLSTTLKLGPLTLRPNVKASVINDYLYFYRENGMVQPKQTSDVINVLSPEMDLHLKFGAFNLRGSFTYNWVNDKGKDVFRIPTQMSNFLLYYQRVISRRAHVLQAGFDGHWQTGYAADMYMPSIMQFYVQDVDPQNQFQINSYFIVDVFAAMKINRTKVFAKYHNLTRPTSSQGYLVRPYYYGFRSVLDVGVSWMFFD